MFRPSTGAVVGNRYRLESVIGRGSLGEIWQAHDLQLDGPCALKLIVGHLATHAGMRARLLNEARTAASLRSAHVVHVLGAGEHEGTMYLAMELLKGETLATRLSQAQLLSPDETVTLLRQLAQALDEAHAAGIVHRDLKPDNLWLCAGPELFVKVLDFGLAQTQSSAAAESTVQGALIGTPHYMSPEQALAEHEVDHRADLWSLAIIAVECLTGKRPFEANGTAPLLHALVSQPAPPLARLGPQLPRALEAWWRRALQRDPEQRFQSAAELVQALQHGLENCGVAAAARTARLRRVAIVVIAGAAATALAAAAWLLRGSAAHAPPATPASPVEASSAS